MSGIAMREGGKGGFWYSAPVPAVRRGSETQEYQVYRAVEAVIDAAISSKHSDNRLNELSATLNRLWQEHKHEFERELNPFVRAGDIQSIARLIFDVYRRHELRPILKRFEEDHSLIGLSSEDWPQWKERVSDWAWFHIKNVYSLTTATAMVPVLQREFPAITPKDKGYLQCLRAPENQSEGWPKLQPKFDT